MALAQTLVQGWPFVHPGIAAAVAGAAAIPILIHLINRQRFQKLPWAAMSFLIAANRRSARRVRIEHFLLLATRVLLILFAGLAIARPFFSNESLGLQSARVHRILVLDQSLSMQAKRADNRTRFDGAMGMAQRLVSSFPPGDGVSLITTAEPVATVISSPTYDRRFLKEILSSQTATQRADNMPEALDAARKLLMESDAPPQNRAVYVLSDFSARDWQSEISGQATPSLRKLVELSDILGPAKDNLVLARVDPGSSENLAVIGFAAEGGLLSMHAPATFRVEVTNFGPSTVRGATLNIRRGSQTIRRETIAAIAPGQTIPVVFSTEFSAPGSVLLEAQISQSTPDSQPIDDTRLLSVEPRESIPVLIVDGQPGARLIDGQAGYLAVALAPRSGTADRELATWGRSRGNLFDVKVISEPELASEPLASYDVVVLCNVPRMGPVPWSNLERFVSDGGGMFLSLGGLVHADNYNRSGYAGGAGIMPAELGVIREVDPEATPRLGFQLGVPSDVMFAEFANHHSSGLFSARVDRYYTVSSLSSHAQIPMRYTNNEPALILSSFGRGTVALWTTTANMDWTNLPGRGDFVAVMAKIAGSIAPQHGRHRNLMVGDILTERLDPRESSLPLRIAVGENNFAEATVVTHETSLAAQFGPLELAGPLTLSIGPERREFAVNTDSREASIESVDPSLFSSQAGRPFRVMTEDMLPDLPRSGASEWSAFLMWLAVGLLVLEIWMAQRFSGPHPVRKQNAKRAGSPNRTSAFRGATSQ